MYAVKEWRGQRFRRSAARKRTGCRPAGGVRWMLVYRVRVPREVLRFSTRFHHVVREHLMERFTQSMRVSLVLMAAGACAWALVELSRGEERATKLQATGDATFSKEQVEFFERQV